MIRRLLLDQLQINITLERLSMQLIEDHEDFSNSVFVGLQPRGIYLTEMILQILKNHGHHALQSGKLDTSFHRDDFRQKGSSFKLNETQVPFLIENKDVILIDDVFFTGRSVRAGLDALLQFGRPSKVQLAVLVERKFSRHVPISPDYVGIRVNTHQNEKVAVEWDKEQLPTHIRIDSIK